MAFRDKNPCPPGGFTNLMQPHLSQNFHFTGGPSHVAPFKPPQSMEDTPSEEQIATPRSSMDNDNFVNVDSGHELPRTEKRILWTQEEDLRRFIDVSCGTQTLIKTLWKIEKTLWKIENRLISRLKLRIKVNASPNISLI